jgi:hypothetical protein
MLLIQDSPEPLSMMQRQMCRLYQRQIRHQWLLVAWAAILCLPPSLWALRNEIALLWEHFTWTGLRYGLAYHLWASFGLIAPLSLLIGLMIRQARDRLFGLPLREQQRLARQLHKIESQGESHPLWRWIQS